MAYLQYNGRYLQIANQYATCKISTGYGFLYNWYAVADSRGLAPTGWHIPTFDEWTTLNIYVSSDDGKLKEAGTNHWQTPNTGATNITGFTALGAGTRGDWFDEYMRIQYGFGKFNQLTNFSTPSETPVDHWMDSTYIWYDNSTFQVSETNMAKYQGCSVRCIRDTSVGWTVKEKAIDYDGNKYDTVKIGTQIFTMQNLAVTHYRNGDSITSTIMTNDQWDALTTEALCAYNNDWKNVFL